VRSFTYERVTDPDAACVAMAAHPDSKFISGGTNLIDLMRLEIERPPHLIDVSRLPLTAIEELPDGTCASAPRHETPTSPPIRSCAAGIQCSLRHCLPGRQGRYGTKRPWAAICCSEHDATTSTTPPRTATSVSRAPAAPLYTALTATMPFWVQARHALPPILPIWPWR